MVRIAISSKSFSSAIAQHYRLSVYSPLKEPILDRARSTPYSSRVVGDQFDCRSLSIGERLIEWVETRDRLGSRKNMGSCFLWIRRDVSELVSSFPLDSSLQVTSPLVMLLRVLLRVFK
ncbi:hypothetical protein M6B38_276765 [Iris pallida]|uniref:Uncharacterized protein n=1 Tax=Iris pallida TaxID=29817 RepID=A0AAX6I4D0_IRIPA|nr:hypothetical protein M6B38_276765 [Iris pallida]